MHTKYRLLPSFFPSFLPFFLFVFFYESPQALDLTSIHVPLVRNRLWEHLMNVFIVVRLSLYTEESLESTFHDATCVPLRSFCFAISKTGWSFTQYCNNKSKASMIVMIFPVASCHHYFFVIIKDKKSTIFVNLGFILFITW